MLYRSAGPPFVAVSRDGHSLREVHRISDADLIDAVCSIQEQNPNCGQELLQGYFSKRGICIQCQRLQESVSITDPCQRTLR